MGTRIARRAGWPGGRPTRGRGAALAGLLVATVGSLGAPASVQAQSVLVRATDASTLEPMQGVLLTLRDAGGDVAGSALSDPRGRFLFTGLVPGAHTLRAEVIGYASEVREGIVVDDGETVVVELALRTRAIELEGIRVEGEERCRVRPEEGLAVSAVWDEVRKALEAARWTEERGVYQYRMRRHTRDVDDRSGRILRQESERSTTYGRVPYTSRPAADLLDNGFVQAADDAQGGDIYFAPDASVLLSDAFLDTHCMRLREGKGEEEGLLGLAFEPVRGRRLPDISGTLWVEPEAWVLSHLAYVYENLPSQLELRNVGGRVDFRRLPNGTWIVPEWRIRMPLLARGRDPRGMPRLHQVGYREDGGSVLRVREPAGDVVLSATTATIEGTVLEEVRSEPVQGARVTLVGTDEEAVTDARGRFRFSELVPGAYEIVFRHPAMDAYGYVPDPVRQVAEVGTVSSVRLRMPNAYALQGFTCAEELDSRPEGTSILVGQVTELGSGLPLEGAEVTIEWDEFDFGAVQSSAGSLRRPEGVGNAAAARREGSAAGRRGSTPPGWSYRVTQGGATVIATTGAEGRYRACVVPVRTPLRVQASWGGFETPPDTVRIPADLGALGHDLAVPVAPRTEVGGTVRGWTGAEPVVGAEVRMSLLGDGGRAAPATVVTTSGAGRFVVPDASPGRYAVEVSALGYATVRDTVEARAGRINRVDVRLPGEALSIEGVTVEVEARVERLDLSGYYTRRREGLGVFLDEDAIAARGVTRTSELFSETPGVRVRQTAGQAGSHLAVVTGRGCMPAVFVDGTLARRAQPFVPNPNPTRGFAGPPPEYLDELVSPGDISGIEVYRSPAEIPAAYTGTGSECGVVLVWTK